MDLQRGVQLKETPKSQLSVLVLVGSQGVSEHSFISERPEMYLSKITIENFRCFGEGDNRFELPLKQGLTALVGENEAGKTAVIDALRFALGTTDQEWYRLEDTDFYGEDTSREIRIVCRFEQLTQPERWAFVEYLTYGEKSGDDPVLYVNWTAKDTGEKRRGQPFRRFDVCSGKTGNGPTFVQEARELVRCTYLRPLRDAEQALSAGRGSRLSQILQHAKVILDAGDEYDPKVKYDLDRLKKLNVRGIGDLANALLKKQQGIVDARGKIDKQLKSLSVRGDELKSNIQVSGEEAKQDVRLRELLQKLELTLGNVGKVGLGSDNLLFMACELLLLTEENEGNKMLLIEEPEAHLHPQRQLRVMKYLQQQANDKNIQIIVSTHSPNLASAIELNNMVMIHNRRAYSLAEGQTELEPSDYRFLQRFLDVTKANLFFARGVMIVEGDGENILVPTLAKLLDRDFTDHGVSIVNVGGTGLRRYARIFQRKEAKEEEKDKQLAIHVACVTDMDVMPNCAGEITRKALPTKNELGKAKLGEITEELRKKASGQYVETFVSDEWTLEYDLAYFGLAEDIYIAASLAKQEGRLAGASRREVVKACKEAQEEFVALEESCRKDVAEGKLNSSSYDEVLASHVYSQFTKGKHASKAIAAQYLAEGLLRKHKKGILTAEALRKRLPKYLVDAIDYVTNAQPVGSTPGSLANE
jgi:putative ATP-dependent endonuclease of OLD family